LALQLDDLDTALESSRSVSELEAEMKWKALGDRALAVWRFYLARECFGRAGDLSALVLLLMATGDRKGLEGLAVKAGRCFFFFVEGRANMRMYRRGEGPE
jgi:coatomer subunit beta'